MTKKLLTIFLLLLMVLGLGACSKKETVEGGSANPMTEVESLERLNELTRGKLVRPGVMGVGNEKYFTITAGDKIIADYQFEVNKDKCDFRFCDRGSLDEDFSGYYVNGKPAFPSTNVVDGVEYSAVDGVRLARWANIDGIYTFAYEKEDLDAQSFEAIINYYVGLTNPVQGDVVDEYAGGWNKSDSLTITKDLNIAVSKATNNTKALYTPLAVLEIQVVSGINYKILCADVETNKLVLLTIYMPASGDKVGLLETEDYIPTTDIVKRNSVLDDGENVYYTTLDINGSDVVVTTVTYSFDENDKLNKIVNETIYSPKENASKVYEEMKTSQKEFIPYTSLEGDRIITDTTEITLPDWGNIGRNELIDTLQSIEY